MTGTIGAMFGPMLLTRFGVTDPLARGIALGTTSHGQGTAAALLEGESAGAMSSLSMAAVAVFTAAIAPLYISAVHLGAAGPDRLSQGYDEASNASALLRQRQVSASRHLKCRLSGIRARACLGYCPRASVRVLIHSR
ncbi:MAG: LrgB family protein [Chloroflexi bacterium]|nr:LrgB family protein [Chloroflexota bacterium]